MNNIKCHIDENKSLIMIEKISESLKNFDNSFILNLKQFFLFNRVLNHYLSSSKKQLFIQINDEIETSKFLCIDMISKHVQYHARQKLESSLIIRAVLIDVTVHNIQNVTLHLLLIFLIQTQFNDLNSNLFIRLQRIFRYCKFLIINKKFMIELRFLYKIDHRLRFICV